MQPRDPQLYESVKQKLYAEQPRHSAYRSMRLQQLYRQAYLEAKPGGKPYIGRKPSRKQGTQRWLDEQWINVKAYVTKRKIVPCGRQNQKGPYPACRPLKRISDKTPVTVKEVPKTVAVRNIKAKETHRTKRQLSWR